MALQSSKRCGFPATAAARSMLWWRVVALASAGVALKTPSHLPEMDALLRRVDRAVDGLDDVDLDKARESTIRWLRKGAKAAKAGVDRYGLAARSLFGASLLFHGGEIGTTLLLMQTIRQSGLPSLKAAGAELAERFESVSEAIEAEAPTLRQTRRALRRLEREADDVRAAFAGVAADFEAGRRTRAEFEASVAKLRRETADLSTAAARAAAGSSSVRHVIEALDPDAIKRLGMSTWHSLLACVAAATQPSAGKVSLGLAIGEDVGAAAKSALVPVLEDASGRLRRPADQRGSAALKELRAAQRQLPPAVRKWTQNGVTAMTQGAMVFAAFKRRQLVLTLSSAALGARLVLEGAHRAGEHKYPPLARLAEGTASFAVAHAGLTALGFSSQVKTSLAVIPFLGKGRVVSPLRWVLKPAFLGETALKALTTKNIASAVL